MQPVWIGYHFDKGWKRVGGIYPRLRPKWPCWLTLIASLILVRKLLLRWSVGSVEFPPQGLKKGFWGDRGRHITCIPPTMRSRSQTQGKVEPWEFKSGFLTRHQHGTVHLPFPTSWAQILLQSDSRKPSSQSDGEFQQKLCSPLPLDGLRKPEVGLRGK